MAAPRGTALNFSEWLRRLRIREADEPELIRSVQPVQLVHDARDLVSPALGKRGLYGARLLGVAATWSTLQVTAVDAGGCHVRVWPTSSVAGYFAYRVAARETLGGANYAVLVGQRTGSALPEAIVERGGGTDPGNLLPAHESNFGFPVPISFYLPSGLALTVKHNAANTTVNFWCEVTGLPGDRS